MSRNPNNRAERRLFMQQMAAGAAAVGIGILAGGLSTFGQSSGGSLSNGDAAILQFAAAVEAIESDLWLPYTDLGDTQDKQLPSLPNGGNPAYRLAQPCGGR